MKKQLQIGLLSLMAILLLGGCKKSEEETTMALLLGKWECTYLDEYESYYYFIKGIPSELGYAITLEFDAEKVYEIRTYNGLRRLNVYDYIYKDGLLNIYAGSTFATVAADTYEISLSKETLQMNSIQLHTGSVNIRQNYQYKRVK